MERSHNQSEKLPSAEQAVELALEKAERHHEKVDEGAEHRRQSESAHEARRKAGEHALSAEQLSRAAETETPKPAGIHHATNKNAAYRKTMRTVRQQLPRTAQIFSRIVHTRGVETAGEVAAKTLFRPLPLVGAGLIATTVTAAVYAIGRYRGYEIAGGGWFLISFGVGYVLGLVIDFARLMLIRRRG